MAPSSGVRESFAAQGAERWSTGPARPKLGERELHVWRIDLRAVDDAVQSTLSESEYECAGAISDVRTRELWARSRGALRTLLARYLRVEPAKVPIALDERGKPRLADEGAQGAGRGLFFNLSHSGHLALYGFAGAAPVGIDVQLARVTKPADARGRQPRDYVAIASRAFGEHQAERLSALDPSGREAEFLRLWTRYEAQLKRVGIGLGARGAKLDAAPWATELNIELDRPHDPPAAAAVAWAYTPDPLRLWRWPVGADEDAA